MDFSKYLYYNNKISVRCYNVLRVNKINSKEELIDIYLNNKIINLKKSGLKTICELNELCEFILGENNQSVQKINKEVIDSFSNNELLLLKNLIEKEVELLSVRAKNAINGYTQKNYDVNNLFDLGFFNINFDKSKIVNLGKKSEICFDGFISKIVSIISNFKNQDQKIQKGLPTNNNNLLFELNFGEKIENLPTSIFQMVEFLIENNFIKINNDNLEIIKKSSNVYLDNIKLTNDEISKVLGITRERVRQKKVILFENLYNKLECLVKFEFDYKVIKNNENYFFVDQSLRDELNEKFNLNFSNNFYTFILRINNPNFIVLGELNDVIYNSESKRRTSYIWKNIYLINKELIDVFDYYTFIFELEKLIKSRRNSDIELNLKGEIFKYLDKNYSFYIEEINNIVTNLLINEFFIFPDIKGNIILLRNTYVSKFEFCYEALNSLGKVSSVEDITSKVRLMYPDQDFSISSVRSSIQRSNDFVPIGRSSMFGLKIWETELDDFKGGTIRSIALEYLNKFDYPISYDDLVEYILIYRDTDKRTIISNLLQDRSKSFQFFYNDYIGLFDKDYDKHNYKPRNK